MKDALDAIHEITKLIKFSPRRDAITHALKAENELASNSHTAGVRVLCPTRWTVRGDSLSSIIILYL